MSSAWMLRDALWAGLLGVGLAAGCTSEQLYEFGRQTGEQKAGCAEMASADERAACEHSFDRDFEDYQAQREAL